MLSSAVKALIIFSNLLGAIALPSRRQVSSCQINPEPDTSDIANTTYVNFVKSAALASGTTYRYVFISPFEPEKPYLLFLHGFPDTSYSWENQINHFKKQGYGIIAPDLLGYGGTDNPSDLQAFSYKNMATEIDELLDCEGIDQVISVSHDLGSPLLSRIHTYYPDRLIALAFLDIGYYAPGTDLNENVISAANNATAATLGYAIYGYWYLFNSEEGASLMNDHMDSLYTIGFTENTTYFRDDFADVGKLERWLAEGRQAPIGGEHVSEATKEQWKAIARAQGGLEGPLKWYKAMMRGINTPDEQEISALPGVIEQPVLLVLADRDPVGLPSIQANSTVPYAANIQIRTANAGHFVHVEAAREVNLHLELFIKGILN